MFYVDIMYVFMWKMVRVRKINKKMRKGKKIERRRVEQREHKIAKIACV